MGVADKLPAILRLRRCPGEILVERSANLERCAVSPGARQRDLKKAPGIDAAQIEAKKNPLAF
jgi:hypothetical protein